MKSRNLSPVEYLKQLEVEWWVNNLRRKICPIVNEKKYYRKVSLLKKDRIIELCSTHDLPNIFSDEKLMKELNKRFMSSKGGCPMFEGITTEDKVYYYYPGSAVRCFYGFKAGKAVIKEGKIENVDFSLQTVFIIFPCGNVEGLEFNRVSRIF